MQCVEVKTWDFALCLQSATKCARVWNSAMQYRKNVKSAKGHQQWLLTNNNYEIILYK